MKNTVNFLLIFLLISSCGEKKLETTTTIIFGGASVVANLDDANIVALRMNDGKKMIFRATPASATTTVTIPNGTWRFYAYGWETTAKNSQMRCAYGGLGAVASAPQDIILNGTTTSISMEFKAINCAFGATSNVFHDGTTSSGTGNFSPLTIHFCNDITGTSCTAYDSTATTNKMLIRSSGFANLGPSIDYMDSLSIKSSCILISGAGNPTSFSMPPGNITTDLPFGLIIQIHDSTDTNCTQNPIKIIPLPDGLAKAQSVDNTLFRLGLISGNLNLYINSAALP